MIWTPRQIPLHVSPRQSQPAWQQLIQQQHGFFNKGCSCCGCVLCGIECNADNIGDHGSLYKLTMAGWGDGTCPCCEVLNGEFELVWSSGCKWVGCAETELACYDDCHGNDGTVACGTHCDGMQIGQCHPWCPCCSLTGNGGCFNFYMIAIDLNAAVASCPDILYSGVDGVFVTFMEGQFVYWLDGVFDCGGDNLFELITDTGTKCDAPETITVSPI